MMLNFKTIMVSDANASIMEQLHDATLRNFIQVLGDVRATAETIALLERRGRADLARGAAE